MKTEYYTSDIDCLIYDYYNDYYNAYTDEENDKVLMDTETAVLVELENGLFAWRTTSGHTYDKELTEYATQEDAERDLALSFCW